MPVMLSSVIAKLSFQRWSIARKCSPKLFSSSTRVLKELRIAIIGQSVFGQEVYKLLKEQGRNVVGVFTVPDANNRPDPLATQAERDGTPVFKFKRWRVKGNMLKPATIL